MPDSFVAPSPVWHNYPQPLLRDRQLPLGRFGVVVDFEVVKDEGIFAHIALEPDLLPLFDAGKLGGVSAQFQANYEASDGVRYEIILHEVSLTDLPRLTTQGRSNAALLVAQLSEGKMTPELEALIAALRESKEFAAMVGEVVKAAMAPAEVETETEVAPLADMAEKDAKIAALSEQLATMKSRDSFREKASALKLATVPPSIESAFLKLAKTDEAAAVAMLSDFAVSRGPAGTPVNIPSTVAALTDGARTQAVGGESDPGETAARAQALHVAQPEKYSTFSAALAAVKKGVA